jgi:hypothetical protein
MPIDRLIEIVGVDTGVIEIAGAEYAPAEGGLTVLAFDPANGATGVSAEDPPLTVTFSADVQFTAGPFAITVSYLSGEVWEAYDVFTEGDIDSRLTISGADLTISGLGFLFAETTYSVTTTGTVVTSLTDEAWDGISSHETWAFTTAP